jgi:hypothetical protein
VLRIQESIDGFLTKKRKVQDEVSRSGGVYGSEELQKYQDNDRLSNYLVEQEISNDIAAKPINLNLESDSSQAAGNGNGSSSSSAILKAHVVVPSQDDIVKVVLEAKKRSMLEKYVL